MPRLREGTVKVQFATSRKMPYLIYQACLRTGTVSNTAYIQRAVADALARDLGIPVENILADIPPNRSAALHLFDPAEGKQARYVGKNPMYVGPANTIEEVR